VIQVVTTHIEDAVEAGAKILKRDLRGEVHQLILGKLGAQTRVEIVGDIRRSIGHRVG